MGVALALGRPAPRRVRELHIAYYEALRKVVQESTPAQRAVLANLQLLRLDETMSEG